MCSHMGKGSGEVMVLFQGDGELVEEECWGPGIRGGFGQARPGAQLVAVRGDKGRQVQWGGGSRGFPYRAEHPQRNCGNGPLALGQN